MKRKNILPPVLAIGAALALTACSGGKQKIYEQACENLEQRKYEKAESDFQDCIDFEMKVPQSQRGKGIAQMNLENYEQAIDSFAAALEGEDSKKFQKDVLSYKATAEYECGRMTDALESCEKIQEIGADAACYYLLGRIGLQLDQYDAAKSNFDAAVERDTSYKMFLNIYQAYGEKDMDADGKAYLSRALELSPKDGSDHYQRGRIYYFMGDFPNAQKELVQASDSGYRDAQLFLVKIYLEQKDTASARSMYQEYAKGDGGGAKAYNGLALCDMAEGNYDGALENIAKGLEVAEPEDFQELLYNEVVAYEYKLDFATAKNKITEYLTRYPDDENAQREAAFLQTR